MPFRLSSNTQYGMEVYDDPTRVVITTEWERRKWLPSKRDTAGTPSGRCESPVLTEVKKSDKVTVLEDENDWMKVATKDGFIG